MIQSPHVFSLKVLIRSSKPVAKASGLIEYILLKLLPIHTKDAYQIACHFHKWCAKGPPLSTAQNSSTIMAKLYSLCPAVLGQVGGEGSEGGGREVEEERGKKRTGEAKGGKGRREGEERGGEKEKMRQEERGWG